MSTKRNIGQQIDFDLMYHTDADSNSGFPSDPFGISTFYEPSSSSSDNTKENRLVLDGFDTSSASSFHYPSNSMPITTQQPIKRIKIDVGSASAPIPQIDNVSKLDTMSFMMWPVLCKHLGVSREDYEKFMDETNEKFSRLIKASSNKLSPSHLESATQAVLDELDINQEKNSGRIKQASHMNSPGMYEALMGFHSSRPSDYASGILSVINNPTKPTLSFVFMNIPELNVIYNSLISINLGPRGNNQKCFVGEDSIIAESQPQLLYEQIKLYGQEMALLVLAFHLTGGLKLQDKKRLSDCVAMYNAVKRPGQPINSLELPDLLSKWREFARNDKWQEITKSYMDSFEIPFDRKELFEHLLSLQNKKK